MNMVNRIPINMLCVFCLVAFIVANVDGQDPDKGSSDSFSQIRKVMSEQSACWNKGDIDGFMKGYWKSEKLTFSAGGKTTRGWQATLDNYKKSYPADKMGQLKFSNLEFSQIAPTAALVLGQWNLNIDGDKKGGNFSLVFKKMDGKWLVIHDHSSSLDKKPEKETPASK